ncbi:DnaA regulatory inactivator HdaA [Mesorhizobium sp. CAU 1732]|uniref:DnaA regulatory inactivator HdaA n=1 Tax=Mesorhizobium sp. CAU 1732 TaxID=3140358 RepID=UPI00326111E0
MTDVPVKPRQLPLDLAHDAAQSRDDLVVGSANAEAVALIDRWPDWPTPVVVLAGPAGSGKSHLAAIWQASSDAVRLFPAMLSTALPINEGPILIDDTDAGAIDETGLFHLINGVTQSGSTMLLTSRRFPTAWGVALPDLASRLKAAATVEIQEPDDALLAGVVTKLFADRQVEVEPHVIQFIVRRIERSLSTAIDVVARLDQAALEQKSRISRALAADILGEMDNGQRSLDL